MTTDVAHVPFASLTEQSCHLVEHVIEAWAIIMWTNMVPQGPVTTGTIMRGWENASPRLRYMLHLRAWNYTIMHGMIPQDTPVTIIGPVPE